jgi:hypothetical protein
MVHDEELRMIEILKNQKLGSRIEAKIDDEPDEDIFFLIGSSKFDYL